MLFHTFKTQKERRNYGGSAFIELQFCDLPRRSSVKDLVDVNHHIRPWKNDSLYVYIDDDNTFYQVYHRIFGCGTYNNMETGPMDLCGINYYAPSRIDPIMEALKREKPADHETLMAWLLRSKAHNGFYILGL